MANEIASTEIKDKLRKLHLDLDEKYQQCKELKKTVQHNHAEMIRRRDMEIIKITDHF